MCGTGRRRRNASRRRAPRCARHTGRDAAGRAPVAPVRISWPRFKKQKTYDSEYLDENIPPRDSEYPGYLRLPPLIQAGIQSGHTPQIGYLVTEVTIYTFHGTTCVHSSAPRFRHVREIK